jgi:hypothetical protein
VRAFEVGALLARVGEVGRGLSVVPAGQVEVTGTINRATFRGTAPASPLGELAQLVWRCASAATRCLLRRGACLARVSDGSAQLAKICT